LKDLFLKELWLFLGGTGEKYRPGGVFNKKLDVKVGSEKSPKLILQLKRGCYLGSFEIKSGVKNWASLDTKWPRLEKSAEPFVEKPVLSSTLNVVAGGWWGPK